MDMNTENNQTPQHPGANPAETAKKTLTHALNEVAKKATQEQASKEALALALTEAADKAAKESAEKSAREAAQAAAKAAAQEAAKEAAKEASKTPVKETPPQPAPPKAPHPKAPVAPKAPPPPTYPTAHEREFLYGHRQSTNLSDDILLWERFGYKKAYKSDIPDCETLIDLHTGKPIGTFPAIQLSMVWKKACDYSKRPEDVDPAAHFGLTESEWKAAYRRLNAYLQTTNAVKERSRPIVLVADVLDLTEITFQALFIKKADRVIELIRTAILQDAEENKYISRHWGHIRKYCHKVPIYAEDEDGIFRNEEDVEILKEAGITLLNDIRHWDIYRLKNLLLSRDLSTIIPDLNEAFREDLAKRRDRRYSIRPFVFGNITLALVLLLGLYYQYTLIKETNAALLLNVIAAVFIICVENVIWAGWRTYRRRKKKPTYTYFVPKVKRRLAFMSVFAIVTVASIALFFHRYDGYDNYFYYRNLDNNTVTVAGLFDENARSLYVPESIDDKTVVSIDKYAFYSEDLTAITLPGTVTTIHTGAFYNCDSLVTVQQNAVDTLPGVTQLEDSAFAKCTRLRDVAFNGNLTTIGDSAFRDCTSLININFVSPTNEPNLLSIGTNAFKDCLVLPSIAFSPTLTVIPDGAFQNCSALTSIGSIDAVTSIGNSAFEGCYSLASISFPALRELGRSAFADCTALTTVLIPDSTESIGKNAFHGCNKIETLTLPFVGTSRDNASLFGSLSSIIDLPADRIDIAVTLTDSPVIYKSNFKNVPALTSLTLGEKTTSIRGGSFEDSRLQTIHLSSGITTLEKNTFKNSDYLTTVTGGTSVTTLKKAVFSGCGALASVELGSLVTIEADAFRSCHALSTVDNLSGLKTLGNNAFLDCTALTTLDLSASSAKLGKNVFEDCSSLTTITLPASLTEIPAATFRNCTLLSTIEIPASVKKIHKNAFESSGLTTMTIGSGVTEIAENAFKDCGQLQSLTIPASVTKVGEGAFSSCSALEEVSTAILGKTKKKTENGFDYLFGSNSSITSLTITGMATLPATTLDAADTLTHLTLDGVVTVDALAMKDHYNLVSITFGSSIQTIGDSAFMGCTNLTAADLSGTGLRELGASAFADCPSMTTLRFPTSGSLTAIPESAFSSCTSLTEAEIPAGVKSIGDNAFSYCKAMYYLALPDSLTTIGNSAFADCSALTDVVIPAGVTSLGSNILNGCTGLETLSLPYIGASVKSASDITYITDADDLITIEITAATSLANRAFENLQSLRTLIINEGCTKLGTDLVDGCRDLDYIIIPSESVYQAHASILPEGKVFPSLDENATPYAPPANNG